MQTYIALLRGINIGGHNKLPMKELRELLGNLGLENVKTYIASGNVVFQGREINPAELEEQISAAIQKDHGFEPRILILKAAEIEAAVQANPFPEAEPEPKSLHLYFLTDIPENPNLEAIEEVKKDNERFELVDKFFYLHAPDGVGRSKLAGRVERYLGVTTTARNWRTVNKIMEMVRDAQH